VFFVACMGLTQAQYNIKPPDMSLMSPQGLRMSIPPPTDGSECTSFPCLIFEDNFDRLDFSKWGHEITAGGGGNWEFQYYTNNRTNSYVRNGVLYIKPTLTEDKYGPGFLSSGTLELWGASPSNLCTGNQWWGCSRSGNTENYINPIQSARLRTVNSFHTTYGKFEVEAQMPKGDWLWPAIWMLPAYGEYGDWPASGEIDIVESRGNADLRDEGGLPRGNSHGLSTMHWGPYVGQNAYYLTDTEYDNTLSDAFHTYAVEWNANEIIFSLDGVQTLRVDPGAAGFWNFGGFDSTLPPESNPWTTGDKMAPFDRSFYIVMNVAVGGTNGYFPDSWTNAGYAKPWSNLSPVAPKEFALAQNLWYPTWNPTVNNGESAAMKVRAVRVYKMSANDVVP